MSENIHIILFILLICDSFQKADVYFTQYITKSNIVKLFKKLNVSLTGNLGLKVHSGETGGKYFLTPDFLQKIYDYTKGTFIECNTAYRGGRHTTERHKNLLKDHGWLENGRRFVIMDENPSDDFNITIDDPVMIEENIVGGHLKDFNSCLVLSHFKGHPMGGFGAALKQLSIGFASQAGKTWIHTAGKETNWTKMFQNKANQENFTAAMGDAAASIVKYFRDRGGIVFITVLANISLYCDCMGGRQPEPKIHDMGIVASTDPIALDRACLDMIVNHTDEGTEELTEQIERLSGENIIYVAEKHKIGSQGYNFINITSETSPYDEDDDGNNHSDNDDNKDNDNENNKNDSPTGVALTVILVSVIIIIITLAILGSYFYMKKKKKGEEIGLILEEPDAEEAKVD